MPGDISAKKKKLGKAASLEAGGRSPCYALVARGEIGPSRVSNFAGAMYLACCVFVFVHPGLHVAQHRQASFL